MRVHKWPFVSYREIRNFIVLPKLAFVFTAKCEILQFYPSGRSFFSSEMQNFTVVPNWNTKLEIKIWFSLLRWSWDIKHKNKWFFPFQNNWTLKLIFEVYFLFLIYYLKKSKKTKQIYLSKYLIKLVTISLYAIARNKYINSHLFFHSRNTTFWKLYSNGYPFLYYEIRNFQSCTQMSIRFLSTKFKILTCPQTVICCLTTNNENRTQLFSIFNKLFIIWRNKQNYWPICFKTPLKIEKKKFIYFVLMLVLLFVDLALRPLP